MMDPTREVWASPLFSGRDPTGGEATVQLVRSVLGEVGVAGHSTWNMAVPVLTLRALGVTIETVNSSSGGVTILDKMPDLGTLYTFGYGSLPGSADLASLIEGHRIDVVFDVRYAPTGRNPLWRSGAVALTVRDGGIPEYVHMQALGNPDFKSGRPAYRVVDEATGMKALMDRLEAGQNVALMCVCKDTPHCHRRLIVAKARELQPGLKVVELERDKMSPTGRRVIRDGIVAPEV